MASTKPGNTMKSSEEKEGKNTDKLIEPLRLAKDDRELPNLLSLLSGAMELQTCATMLSLCGITDVCHHAQFMWNYRRVPPCSIYVEL
ncbi:hypothetical protein LEMLEM_LOCUS6980 [Lemmus lemmus]